MRNELLSLFGRKRSQALDVSRLPLFLREYLDLTQSHTDAKPGLLLTALLPHLAVCLGNRVYMVNNSLRIYPNVWGCLIGPSSVSRKTTAISFAGYTLRGHEAELDHLPVEQYEQKTLILTSVTASKLLTCLAQNPCRLFVHHELSAWLAEMNKHFNAGYKQVVTELYDGVDKTVSTQTRTERVRRPALSIASATTEAWLYKNIRETADQLGGFLQRFLYYVVRDVDLSDIDLSTRSGVGLEDCLIRFGKRFAPLRELPGSHRLELDAGAAGLRDEAYQARYRRWFARNNDTLMSYFTRVYDGYFFKFCAIISLCQIPARLESAIASRRVEEFFAQTSVSPETAEQALYLCDFYFHNTIPFLEIVEEQDRLAGERKLVELLIRKYDGKASHSALMNSAHMKKREFKECVDSLIEREAITVEAYKTNTNSGRAYILAPDIMDSWKD
jgi:hypothetical protein